MDLRSSTEELYYIESERERSIADRQKFTTQVKKNIKPFSLSSLFGLALSLNSTISVQEYGTLNNFAN